MGEIDEAQMPNFLGSPRGDEGIYATRQGPFHGLLEKVSMETTGKDGKMPGRCCSVGGHSCRLHCPGAVRRILLQGFPLAGLELIDRHGAPVRCRPLRRRPRVPSRPGS